MKFVKQLISNIDQLIAFFPPDNFYRKSLERYRDELHPNVTSNQFAKAFLDANVRSKVQVTIAAGTNSSSGAMGTSYPWPKMGRDTRIYPNGI